MLHVDIFLESSVNSVILLTPYSTTRPQLLYNDQLQAIGHFRYVIKFNDPYESFIESNKQQSIKSHRLITFI